MNSWNVLRTFLPGHIFDLMFRTKPTLAILLVLGVGADTGCSSSSDKTSETEPTDASTSDWDARIAANEDAATPDANQGTSTLCPTPSASNTGPSDPSVLMASGSISSTMDGQVIENVDVTGSVTILHKNVVLRNFRILTTSHYGIRANDPAVENLLIEHGDVAGAQSSGIIVSNGTVRSVNIHDTDGDGGKSGSNVRWECNWFHHLGRGEGAHADGIQVVAASNLQFIGNNFDMPIPESPNGPGAPYKSNAALFLSTNNGPISNVKIAGNVANGGNFTIYLTDKDNGHGAPTNVELTNNQIGPDYRYGTFANHVAEDSLFACGNTWVADGAPVPKMNGDGDVCPGD